jgi:CarD family transcriptional regulator
MQFQIGDQVVHPVHGVGTITTFSKQRFVGAIARPYYEVTHRRATVWVPVDERGLTVLRGIASKDSLKSCRKLLKSPPVPLVKNRQQRQHEIAQRLEGRSLPSLCRIVRDLRGASRLKPLGATESDLLHKTFQALCDEWAASDGVTSKLALDEIESLLQVTPSSQPLPIRF